MADHQFDFEAEFSLLDIGATSTLMKAGVVRPTVLAYSAGGAVEAVSLSWRDEAELQRAFEESRRYARDLEPDAYALVALVSLSGTGYRIHQPEEEAETRAGEALALAMRSKQGAFRAVTYPVRRSAGKTTLGAPAVLEEEHATWVFLGDIWGNPFCEGDTVKFRPGERAVDPSSDLWKAIVELTRMRIQEDQAQAEEYMAFLDDLRNGIFLVAGRSGRDLGAVRLKPRTGFNPLGVLVARAERLMLTAAPEPQVRKAVEA